MPDPNYDESKVPAYTLPDPLIAADGRPVTDPAQWRSIRRPELLDLFAEHIYGRAPIGRPGAMRHECFDETFDALGGLAIRRQIRLHLSPEPDGPSADLLMYLPRRSAGPVPTFVGLNFQGNHSVHADPAIRLSTNWMRPQGAGVVNERATESARGTSPQAWPIEPILQRGYGVATIYYGDFALDNPDTCFASGMFRLIPQAQDSRAAADRAGAIAAWAWGLSRAMDYLQFDADIDSRRVIVTGHSRLGKAALWAGALDERFAAVISNQSGCLGAALSRRRYGESIERITKAFPHWFCPTANTYAEREDALPIDQHELIALQAPRPVLVCSAEKDQWADPRGEFLAARGADPVYRLLGTEGLATSDMPRVNQPVLSRIGYNIRPGSHGVISDDWTLYMDFADQNLRAR